ncbi:MAG: hypothetical protein A2283_13120 [Lentisphaerae bacterium RIFOXYA12_FULL_48_11]|nr:MAG: hypothetical protein A2283_13120 [Lentisphaerae bacterium RIFOXYA12_FULL_48_11]
MASIIKTHENAVPSGLIDPISSRTIWMRLAWVAVYAIAMGFLEAVCVIYIRKIFPVETNFPIPPMDQLGVEIVREVCTIIMLVAVAWLGGINFRTRLACFFYAFGLWDIFYYVGLAWMIGWPSSLLDWDCLFLIPKPWYGPVLAPVLISVYFILGCCFLHVREIRNNPLRISVISVMLQLTMFTVWYWSFVKDADQITANGFSGVVYSWPLFMLGLFPGIAGLWLTTRKVTNQDRATAQSERSSPGQAAGHPGEGE